MTQQVSVIELGAPLRLTQLSGAVKILEMETGNANPEITIEPRVQGERDPYTTGYRIIAKWGKR